MLKRCHFLLLILVVVLFVAACAPTPQLRSSDFLPDTSIIHAEAPCEAPCWHDIILGETTWDDAFRNVASDVNFANFRRSTDRDTGARVANFSYLDGPQCCRLFSRDGVVMSSVLLLTTPQITVAQVLERYGEPQYLRAEDVTTDQTFVSLVYSDVPMVVYAFATGLASGAISAESEIIGYVYMTSAEMDITLATASDLHSWTGYGALADVLASAAVTP